MGSPDRGKPTGRGELGKSEKVSPASKEKRFRDADR